MKKILGILVGFIMIFSSTVFAATKPEVSFTVNGKPKKGEKITIYVMIKDVSNLYALSTDYIYDPECLKVTSIEKAGLIKESKLNLMQPGGQTDKDGNRANYQMTFTGKVKGVSGSGEIVKIEAEVLKDFEVAITEENMKIKLVSVDSNYNVDTMDFTFNSIKPEGTSNGGNPDDTGNNGDTGNDGESSENPKNPDETGNEESGSKDEVKNDENTSTETGNENADNNKPSKPSLIDKIINIFKKNPEVKLEDSKNNSSNGQAENKNEDENKNKNEDNEVKNDTDKISNDENEKSEGSNNNKVDESSNKSALGKVLGISIAIALVGGTVYFIIRKKHNNINKTEE